jgi:hypothetical protein
MQDNPSKKSEIISAIKPCFESSSIHSFPQITTNKSFTIRLIWIICFTIGLGTCSVEIYRTLVEFSKHEVVTQIRVVTPSVIDFPEVKICSLNMFTTEFARQKILESLVQNGFEEKLNLMMNHSLFEIYDSFSAQSSYLGLSKFLDYVSLSIAMSLNDTEKAKLDSPVNELLISCTFQLNMCNVNQDFEYFYDTLYGNCIKFNSGKNMMGQIVDLKQSSATGRYNFYVDIIIVN